MKRYGFLIFLLPIMLFSQTDFQLQLNQALLQVQAQFDVIGFSVLVVSQDEVIFSNGFGRADVERNIPVQTSTKYRIASISKIITATALMRLFEEGLVLLEEDISTYLGYQVRNPNFPNSAITLRHLMTHTSSLRDGNGYFNFLSASYGTSSPPDIEELLTPSGDYYASNIFSSYYEAGNPDGWDYCNLGAGVVATIIENVSGQLFHQFCREHIFLPLDIDACWQDFENISDMNLLSVIYRYDQNGNILPIADNYQGIYPPQIDWEQIPPGTNGLIHGPQGSLRISSEDLAKIMLAYMQNGEYNGYQLLQRETKEMMLQTHWQGYGMGGFFTRMGLQFQITDGMFPNEIMYGHAGEAYGLLSDMYFDQSRDFGVIFIMNGADYGYGEGIFYDVEEAVFSAIWELLPLVSVHANDLPELQSISLQNFPNPFNPSTTIQFSSRQFAENEQIALEIYNAKGQRIRQFNINHSHFKMNEIVWDGTDSFSRQVSSGIYFFTILKNGMPMATRKGILLK